MVLIENFHNLASFAVSGYKHTTVAAARMRRFQMMLKHVRCARKDNCAGLFEAVSRLRVQSSSAQGRQRGTRRDGKTLQCCYAPWSSACPPCRSCVQTGSCTGTAHAAGAARSCWPAGSVSPRKARAQNSGTAQTPAGRAFPAPQTPVLVLNDKECLPHTTACLP